MPLNRWALAAGAAGGLLVGALGMIAAGREADGADIRRYLLAHPEVITEAMQKLQDRETGKLIARHRDAIARPYAGAWAGNPRGDVTVVEYFDYQCGYCRSSLPVLEQMLARNPNVRLVYRELPILSDESRVAARASLAAAAAGADKYRAFHAALFAAGPVTPDSIAIAARRAGVDPAAVPADAEAEIERNRGVAEMLRLNGTPSWVVGDRVLIGAQSLDTLEAAIKAAREG